MLRRDDKGVKEELRKGAGEARCYSTGLNRTHRKDRDVRATRRSFVIKEEENHG